MILLSEWTKLRTIRSTVWALVLTFVLSVGISVLLAGYLNGSFDSFDAGYRDSFDPIEFALGTIAYGQIVLVAFGVLAVSSEYGSGTIRSSLAAVPRRGQFFAAKIAVGTAAALVVSMITVFVMFFAAQAFLGSLGGSLGDPGALRAVFGTGLYLTLVAVFSMGAATILRSSGLSLGILIPFFFVVSNLVSRIPGIEAAGHYLPDQAGKQIMVVTGHTDSPLGPWQGLLVLAAWAAAAVLAGYVVLRHRDA
ncbi:ABC transporter permease [Amycolatopsis magusensis]|uniref:ABC-2 type transport system permease protein n=1 Tax=Amycolatopsis magusensis TaxID=882444 RepID=A0ABS4PQR0_9PSEU|nr:ABC transporter permease [Amycolatopsis magusensis]MBP2181755.1 ABC-2 type transport system permease protein [Amycolatopsis magusensis]